MIMSSVEGAATGGRGGAVVVVGETGATPVSVGATPGETDVGGADDESPQPAASNNEAAINREWRAGRRSNT